MIDLCQSFVHGFNEVIPFSSTKIFDPEEFVTLLSGSGKKITVQELSEHVEIGKGYDKSSPQFCKHIMEQSSKLM